MIRDAIDRVLDLRDPPTLVEKFDGADNVWIKDGYMHQVPAAPKPLRLHTLASVVDAVLALEAELDDSDDLMLVVDTDASVVVVGNMNAQTKKRPYYAECLLFEPAAITGIGSGGNPGWMTANNMIPSLLTAFANTPERASLLQVLGNVRDGRATTYQDDGVGQEVSTRKGVELAERTALPSPLLLEPLATYQELGNIQQEYILRAEGGDENSPPTFMLSRVWDPVFECNRAASIRRYLREQLVDRVVVGWGCTRTWPTTRGTHLAPRRTSSWPTPYRRRSTGRCWHRKTRNRASAARVAGAWRCTAWCTPTGPYRWPG
jgi:hypothetical protein